MKAGAMQAVQQLGIMEVARDWAPLICHSCQGHKYNFYPDPL